ncbi:MAG: hypothetical protein B6I28_06490 [Fusobacteriia bacterium 4572_132]|nr:MAG: hypothetical protein B6I28_06490 [Fusobacteriia bacterium 4572_132]
MKEINFNSRIFKMNLSLKAIAIYVYKRNIQKTKFFSVFELRKEFKNGETSIKSGIEELKSMDLIYESNDEMYTFNYDMLSKETDKLIDSFAYKNKDLRLGELGMYIFLLYSSIKEGRRYNEEFECYISRNYSIDELAKIIEDGKFSIRNKINKLIEHNLLNRYPVYIDGQIEKWSVIINTSEKNLIVLTASKRKFPEPNFIKQLNKKSKIIVNDPYLIFKEINYLKLKDKEKNEEYYLTLLNEDINKFRFIYR